MKRKIFLRFFAVTLAAVLLIFAFGIIAVNINAKSIITKRLTSETELATALIDNVEDLTRLGGYGGKQDMRLTVVDTEGNVLYESDTGAELENHKDREEIKSALNGTPTTVERYSYTFQCDMIYYAKCKTLQSGEKIVIRLAVRSSEITPYISTLLPLLIGVLAIALICSYVLSYILSNSLCSKFNEISTSLKSVNDGNYTPIKTDMSEPELYSVLTEINGLNVNICSHTRLAERERSKLNTVLDGVSQGIIAIDEDKHIVFANKSACELFHGSHYDIGRDLLFLIDDLEIYKSICDNLTRDRVFLCSYGERELSISLTKPKDKELTEDVSVIIIVTDITKERLIEKQKALFFANASHELKTPVTVLGGLSELLLAKDGIDEGSKKQLSRIHKESIRLGNLISDMLMLSRIESGESGNEDVTEVSLDAISAEVLDGYSRQIKEKNISTELIGYGKINADVSLIYELIDNLVSNAVKYNKDGGSVSVSISEDNDSTRLTVKDTGIGIEREHLPRICERFYREDKSHSKRVEGTGLGLAIVKHICAVSGAELNIDSDFGIGTTVTVVFPKAQKTNSEFPSDI